MKNDKLKMTKIETEQQTKNFHTVPIILTKQDYEKFKTYDEDLIAKIICYAVHSVNNKLMKKSKGLKLQLIVKND